MISKELLGKVLGGEVSEIDDNMPNEYSDDVLYIIDGHQTTINIYELAHKCKEWAANLQGKRYQLYSGFNRNNALCEVYSGAIKQTDNEFESETEPEAIFKACQWILDNK